MAESINSLTNSHLHARTQYVVQLSIWLICSVCSNNFLKLDIYYGELKVENIEQTKAYDVISFFSQYPKAYDSSSSVIGFCNNTTFRIVFAVEFA